MNIIIVGCGKVGSTLAGQLSQEGYNISIIDINEKGKIALSIKKAIPEEEAPAPKKTYDKPKKSQPPVWTGTQKSEPENMSFEDMLARFKTKSDERMSDLKKNTAAKRGSSAPRRGGSGTQRGF